jgi:hypothetical protein
VGWGGVGGERAGWQLVVVVGPLCVCVGGGGGRHVHLRECNDVQAGAIENTRKTSQGRLRRRLTEEAVPAAVRAGGGLRRGAGRGHQNAVVSKGTITSTSTSTTKGTKITGTSNGLARHAV